MKQDNPGSFQEALQNAIRKQKLHRETNIKPEFGKLPPQAVELEKAVLGAILLEKEAYDEVVSIIGKNSFYLDEHSVIFEACSNLRSKGNPVDLLTVTEELKRMGKLELVGGPYRLAEMANTVGSSANIAYHAQIIKEKSMFRDVIRVSSEAISKAYDPSSDPFETVDSLNIAISDIGNIGHIKGPVTTKDGMVNLLKIYDSPVRGAGISSGIDDFDSLFNGFEGGDLIILGARPSMGKTMFALELAKWSAASSCPIGFFSLEMPNDQLMQRLVSNIEEIPLRGIRTKNLNQKEFLKFASSRVEDYPIYIDDSAAITVSQMKAKAIKWKKEFGIGGIIIDYLQLVTPTNRYKGDEVREIGEISRDLKKLAKELNIPVIALSQLSRDVEKRPDKRPRSSDLRSSGSLEQDADAILFLYRDYYYYKDQVPAEEQDRVEILVAKNRNGESGLTIFAKYVPEIQRMENWYGIK